LKIENTITFCLDKGEGIMYNIMDSKLTIVRINYGGRSIR
jgi:hypothetical protein